MNRIFLIFLLSNSLLFSQNSKFGAHTIYLNYPDYTVKANVFDANQNVILNDTLFYYWYNSNKIFQTQGGFDGKLLNGPYCSFFINGNLKESGAFKKGLKHGIWYSWEANGKLKDITSWKSGIKNGVWKEFNSNGSIKKNYHYKNGLLHGYYYEYNGNGILLKKKFKKGKIDSRNYDISTSNDLDSTNVKKNKKIFDLKLRKSLKRNKQVKKTS